MRIFVGGVAGLLLCSELVATSFLPESQESVDQRACLIGAGSITSKEVKKTQNSIVTEYGFELLPEENHWIAGAEYSQGQKKITFQLPGGSLNGINTRGMGVPEFKLNQILFAHFYRQDCRNTEKPWTLYSWTQGQELLVREKGELVVARPRTSLARKLNQSPRAIPSQKKQVNLKDLSSRVKTNRRLQ